MVGMITQWLPPPEANGPVTCDVCGCRLIREDEDGAETWRHFPSLASGQDARGCRPFCVEAPHDRFGRSIADLVTA